MSTPNVDSQLSKKSQDAWAAPVSELTVGQVPEEALNLNVDGRQPVSPLQGFGQLWQKTFQVRLSGVDLPPEEVMRIWREKFPTFQPPENRFYPEMTGISPGAVVLINAKVPPLPGMPSLLPVSTGVMVLYADEEMFTVMCPEGHPLSGWNTFSVFEEDGTVVAQVKEMSRASDPMYEFFNRFMGASEQQDRIWTHVLTQLAAHFDVKGQVTMTKTLIDPQVQWSEAKNIWKNAGIRTVFYVLGTPVRWLRSPFRSNGKE